MEDAPYAYTVPAFMILARTAVLKMNVAIGAGPVAGGSARTRRRTPSRRRLAGREWERARGAARCPLLEDDTGQRTNIQGIDLKQVTGAGAQGAARTGHARARGFAQPSPGVSSGSGCGPPMEVEIWMCTGAAGRQALFLPPAGIAVAQSQDAIGQAGRLSGLGGGDEGGGERASRVLRL